MQVEGFGGARYKSFLTEKEARTWLLGGSLAPLKKVKEPKQGEFLESGADTLKSCRVYTDGSCLKNPNGPGGWAFCIVRDGEVTMTLSGGAASSTNNRMEMLAAIEALRHLPKHEAIILSTDSQYLKNGITKWIYKWKRCGWKKADATPVLNQELWRELDALLVGRNITFRWVKGHMGNKYNELCDALAKKEARAFMR